MKNPERFNAFVSATGAVWCSREGLGNIADNLSKAGWSWGWVSAVDFQGRTMWIVDAHRDDEKRFIVHADEKLTAFLQLERAIHRLRWMQCRNTSAHGGKRFVVHAEEKLTGVLETGIAAYPNAAQCRTSTLHFSIDRVLEFSALSHPR